MTTILSDKTVKARKPYRCDECHGVIEVGTRYEKRTQIFDGEFQVVKLCVFCNELWNEVCNDGIIKRAGVTSEEILIGDLHEFIRDDQDSIKTYIESSKSYGGIYTLVMGKWLTYLKGNDENK